jgi:hypothetical protein
MAHDVFISYSAKDKPVADAVSASLEASGVRCWIAPRNIQPGADWGESIVKAIAASRVMVLVFSSHVNISPPIRAEVEQAFKRGLPIIPFRIENVVPSEKLELFLAPSQWLNAYTEPLEKSSRYLSDVVTSVLGIAKPEMPADEEAVAHEEKPKDAEARADEPVAEESAPQAPIRLTIRRTADEPKTTSLWLKSRKLMWPVIAGAGCILAAALVGFVLLHNRPTKPLRIAAAPNHAPVSAAQEALPHGLLPEVRESVLNALTVEKNARQAAASAREVQAKAQDAVKQARDAAALAEKGRKDGYGILTGRGTRKGVTWRYAGQVKFGAHNGFGVMQWSSGEKDEGRFGLDGLFGYGAVTWKNGDRTEGKIANGQMSGAGVQTYRGGAHYEGEQQDGARAGYGVYYWPQPSSSQEAPGQYSTGRMNGYGVLVRRDGIRLVGHWVDDELTGYAAMLDAEKQIVSQGLYAQGKLQSSVTFKPAGDSSAPH